MALYIPPIILPVDLPVGKEYRKDVSYDMIRRDVTICPSNYLLFMCAKYLCMLAPPSITICFRADKLSDGRIVNYLVCRDTEDWCQPYVMCTNEIGCDVDVSRESYVLAYKMIQNSVTNPEDLRYDRSVRSIVHSINRTFEKIFENEEKTQEFEW